MIDKYLDRGKLFALCDDGLKSICVVTEEGNDNYELQNLATYEQFQRKGYRKNLVKHIFPIIISVEQGEMATVSVTNKPLTGLTIKKIDSDSKELLAGAEFEIYRQNEATPIFTGVTDTSGILTTGYLENGYYIVKKTKAPKNYLLEQEPKIIEIKAGQPYILTVQNKKLSGFKIVKTDENTKEPLSGAVFHITKADGTNYRRIYNRYQWNSFTIRIRRRYLYCKRNKSS